MYVGTCVLCKPEVYISFLANFMDFTQNRITCQHDKIFMSTKNLSMQSAIKSLLIKWADLMIHWINLAQTKCFSLSHILKNVNSFKLLFLILSRNVDKDLHWIYLFYTADKIQSLACLLMWIYASSYRDQYWLFLHTSQSRIMRDSS